MSPYCQGEVKGAHFTVLELCNLLSNDSWAYPVKLPYFKTLLFCLYIESALFVSFGVPMNLRNINQMDACVCVWVGVCARVCFFFSKLLDLIEAPGVYIMGCNSRHFEQVKNVMETYEVFVALY